MPLLSSAFALSFLLLGQFKPLDPELKNYRYPFPVREYTVVQDGEKLKMAYMDVEPSRSNGQTVVLLHGKNFSGAYWESTIRDLTSRGYRVIAPDQIGFGKSSKPEKFPFTFEFLAKLTNDLVQSRGVKQYQLVGHSMGGMLAVRLALMEPTAVTKLVLVNPIGLEDYRTLTPPRTVEELYQAELKANEESIRQYQRTNYFNGSWKSEYDRLLEIPVGWTLHKDYSRVAWNAAQTSHMIYCQPVADELKNLTQTTLLIIGTKDRTAPGKDRVEPDQAKEMGRYDRLGRLAAAQIPNSFLIEIAQAGHLPQVDAYDDYMEELLKFLKYEGSAGQ